MHGEGKSLQRLSVAHAWRPWLLHDQRTIPMAEPLPEGHSRGLQARWGGEEGAKPLLGYPHRPARPTASHGAFRAIRRAVLGDHLLFGFDHRWHSAELLHHAEGVRFFPLLSNLSPDDAVNHHTACCHQPARGRNSHEIPPMDAIEGPTGHHFGALSYLVLNRPSAIGKGGKHLRQELFISLAPELDRPSV